MKKTLSKLFCQVGNGRARRKSAYFMIATLLIICSLQVQAADTLKGFTNSVTVTAESSTLKEVLNSVEKQTGYKFFYNHRVIMSASNISLDLVNVPFFKALTILEQKTGLDFMIRGDQVVVKRKNLLRTVSTDSFLAFDSGKEFTRSSSLETPRASLEQTVTGKVTDEGGNGMPGVNVVVKGTAIGTSTDTDGKFSIALPKNDATLVFSFIGYETQEIAVGSQTTINITLKPDVTTLNEIVVVGYGTQKRTSVTGAVSSVGQKEISALPVPSVESAIQGRVAGVIVTNNGSPGSTPIVRIRGVGSITGSSDPLYVVDGFPTSGLNNFDPKDIESVEVLKDAAAAAIYGSRASNGVILITTKKGARGKKTSVDVDSYYGVQTAWKKLDLLNRDEYLRYGTDLITNSGGTLPKRFSTMNDPIYPGASQTYAQTETDWQDAMFRSAPIYQTQAALSTSSDVAKLYTSAGMFRQEGIMLGTDFKRYNYRLNSEIKITKAVTFGQTLTIAYSERRNENQSGGRTQIQHIVHQVPYIPVHDPTLLGGYRTADNNDGSDPENPVRIAMMDVNRDQTMKLFGTAYLSVALTPWLDYKFTMGGDFSSSRNRQDYPMFFDGFAGRNTHNLNDNRATTFSPLFQNQLTIDKDFGKHSFNVTAVAERQDWKYSYLNASAQQGSNLIQSLQGGQNQAIGYNDTYSTSLLSFLGRLNYEYGNKYLLSASLRRDGYSGFAPGHKWGNFPGVSVGWRVSEEEFMRSIPAISQLKIRASYGSLGVNNVGAFDWQSLIGINTTYPFNNTNTSGSYFQALPNSNLSWETTKMTNVGADFALFNDKITFTAEYYQRKVDNLLLRVPLAPSTGYSVNPLFNVGKMENTGFEFQLGYNQNTGPLKYNVSANIGTIQNKVTDLYIPNSNIYAGSNGDFGGYNITKTEQGHAMQGFYGWVTDGLFQSQAEIDAADKKDGDGATKYQSNAAPGDIRFKDLNNDGHIDEQDRTYLGSFLPKFTYGMNVSATYKNFDVTLFLQGVSGNKIYNGTKVLTQGMLRLFGADKNVLRAWRPDNTNTDVPRAVAGDPNQNSRTSDRFVENGSYLRVKSFNIGYTFPATIINAIGGGRISKLRLYVSSQNLLTFTKYSGYDPEIGARSANSLVQGIDYGQFPQARTIMGGIQIGL
jgi:TonB-linked SusC/RagA family outer membrane protein